jgi:hypothetical protein
LTPDYLRNNTEYLPTILRLHSELVDLDNNLTQKEKTTEIIRRMVYFLKKFDLDLHRLPLDISPQMISKEGISETEACITLASKSIINVDSVDWKQVMEFRRDREAREKLAKVPIVCL